LLVDKLGNEPRAGNPVDHRTFSGNPFHDMASTLFGVSEATADVTNSMPRVKF
jgi:hypothetical protein